MAINQNKWKSMSSLLTLPPFRMRDDELEKQMLTSYQIFEMRNTNAYGPINHKQTCVKVTTNAT